MMKSQNNVYQTVLQIIIKMITISDASPSALIHFICIILPNNVYLAAQIHIIKMI